MQRAFSSSRMRRTRGSAGPGTCREGYLVGTARSRRDALAAVRRNRPDLVLPVVTLTAKVEESDVLLVLGAGAEDSIEKPFRMPLRYTLGTVCCRILTVH